MGAHCADPRTVPPVTAPAHPRPARPVAAPSAEAGLPILKWVGGKSRLLPRLTEHYDEQATVIEPFFGGGALSFHLAAQRPDLRVVANDQISPLIDIYQAVRDDVEAFIADVDHYALPYLALDGKDARRAFYYQLREQYMTSAVDGPAPLFFMLWCAYSGLYRTGKKYPGRFNTSHGFGAEKPDFYHADRLRSAAAHMATWQFSAGDFMQALDATGTDTFVLLDPPYRGTYTGYTGDGFDEADQLRVVEFFKAADARGAKVVYTNKYTADGYYEQHFAGYRIDTASIRYQVNRNCADVGRPETLEVIISN